MALTTSQTTVGSVQQGAVLDPFDNVSKVPKTVAIDATGAYLPDNTVFGAQGDGAWSGSGNATLNAVLKAVYNRLPSGANVRRTAAAIHRSAITTVDKLAVPTLGGPSGQTDTGGSLVGVTTYNFSVVAANAYGATTPAIIQAIAPGGSNNAARIPITQVTGATAYDVFLSVDAAPKWVCRITEAQRAAGGIVTTVGGAPAAGGAVNSIDIGIVGTGAQTTAPQFAANNAYSLAGITPIACAGFSRAEIFVELTVADLRSTPAVSVLAFLQNITSGNYHAGSLRQINPLGGAGSPQRVVYQGDVDGAANLIIAVESIAGQAAACNVWVELD